MADCENCASQLICESGFPILFLFAPGGPFRLPESAGCSAGWYRVFREVQQETMTEIHCGALLFDMDGVVIDSTPAVARVWRNWAIEHGFDPVEVVARAHGRPSLTTIREYLPKADPFAENREVERREIEDVEGVVFLPGARELLASLPQGRWTIATSCTRALAEVRLRVAGLPIPERLVTSSDVTNGKPHPEPFLKAAASLGFTPQACIVLEDAPAGIRAGKASGARVIAFRTTVPEEELHLSGADWIVNSCAEIELGEVEPADPSRGLTLLLHEGIR
jgi:sugar-phosphatase